MMANKTWAIAAAVLLLVAGATLGSAAQAATSSNRVIAVEFENDVNPVTRDFVEQQIDRAEREDYDAVVILLDTPGGLVSSMEDIVKAELASTVPVIVYVSPTGARAASAGAFITIAAHVAAMAPATNIGAAHPVAAGGGTMDKEMTR